MAYLCLAGACATSRPVPHHHVRLRVDGEGMIEGRSARRGVHVREGVVFAAFHTYEWMEVDFDPSHRATLRLEIEAPPGDLVVAPGDLVARHRAERWTRWVFALDAPHPAYLYGFAIGDLRQRARTIDGIEHRIAQRRGASLSEERLFDTAAAAIRTFEALSGQPYPGRAFTQVWVPGPAAQELAFMAIMDEEQARAMLADPTEDWLFVHEIAHQWWGNRVTCASWSELWLNEGFATFMVAAYKERRWGRAAYDREVRLAEARVARLRAQGRARALWLPEGTSFEDAGGPWPYSEGLLVLHAIRSAAGDDAFWEGVRAYTADHWNGRGATSTALRRAFERACGCDLAPIFTAERFPRSI